MNPLALRSIPMWAWILTAALCVFGVQQWRVHHYKAQATALQGVANTLHDANQSNLATIDALKATNADWASKCKANEPEARQQAQLSVAGDAKRQAESAASVKKLRESANHDASVKTWMDGSVPADVVRVLAQGGTH